jgi:hypothetical protein
MKYHEIPVKTLFIFHIFGGVHYRNQVVRMQAETHASTKKFGKNIWQHVGWSENGVPPTPLVNHHFPLFWWVYHIFGHRKIWRLNISLTTQPPTPACPGSDSGWNWPWCLAPQTLGLCWWLKLGTNWPTNWTKFRGGLVLMSTIEFIWNYDFQS